MTRLQSDVDDDELIGELSIGRFLAADIDLVLSIAVSFFIGSLLLPFGDMVAGLSAFALFLVYYFLSEALAGTTPGKMLFGLHVRTTTGERCTWMGALLRTATRILEANPLAFGGLPAGIAIFSSKRRQRLGDMLAGTIVVSRRELRRAQRRAESGEEMPAALDEGV